MKSGAVARRLAVADPAAPAGAPANDQDYTDRTRRVYQELRDRKVAMFLDRLPEGVWEIRYALRADEGERRGSIL